MTKLAAYRVYYCVTCQRTLRGSSAYGSHVKFHADHIIPGYVLLCGRRHCPNGQDIHLSHDEFISMHAFHIKELGGDATSIPNGTFNAVQKANISLVHVVNTGLVMQHGSNTVITCSEEYRAVFGLGEPFQEHVVQAAQRTKARRPSDKGFSYRASPQHMTEVRRNDGVRTEAPTERRLSTHVDSPAEGESFLGYAWRGAVAFPESLAKQQFQVPMQRIKPPNRDNDNDDDFVCPLPPPSSKKPRLTNYGPGSKGAAAVALPIRPAHPKRRTTTRTVAVVPLINPTKEDVAAVVAEKRCAELCREIFGSDSESSDSADNAMEQLRKSIPIVRFPSSRRNTGLTQDPIPIACSTQQHHGPDPALIRKSALPTLHSSKLPSHPAKNRPRPSLSLRRPDRLLTAVCISEDNGTQGHDLPNTIEDVMNPQRMEMQTVVIANPPQQSLALQHPESLQTPVCVDEDDGTPLQDEQTAVPDDDVMNVFRYPPTVEAQVAALPEVLLNLLESCRRPCSNNRCENSLQTDAQLTEPVITADYIALEASGSPRPPSPPSPPPRNVSIALEGSGSPRPPSPPSPPPRNVSSFGSPILFEHPRPAKPAWCSDGDEDLFALSQPVNTPPQNASSSVCPLLVEPSGTTKRVWCSDGDEDLFAPTQPVNSPPRNTSSSVCPLLVDPSGTTRPVSCSDVNDDQFADSQPCSSPPPANAVSAFHALVEDLALTPSILEASGWVVQTQEECRFQPPTTAQSAALEKKHQRAFGMLAALSQELSNAPMSTFAVSPVSGTSQAYLLARQGLPEMDKSELLSLLTDIVEELGKRIQ